MYWVHRFGHGPRRRTFQYFLDVSAMYYLLKEKHCLTVGWLGFSDTTSNDYNPDIVNAVETGNPDQVMKLMLDAGKNWTPPIDSGWANSLVYFTKMQPGDIVVVLPNKDCVPYFFVAEIKSAAKSILKSPSNMTSPFKVSGVDFSFSSSSGWTRNEDVLDVGFFHEVELLTKELPRDLIGGMFNSYRRTNSPINDVSKQQYIDSLISKP